MNKALKGMNYEKWKMHREWTIEQKKDIKPCVCATNENN